MMSRMCTASVAISSWSTPNEPYSRTMTSVRPLGWWSGCRLSSVVLPAPRNPATTVTGLRRLGSGGMAGWGHDTFQVYKSLRTLGQAALTSLFKAAETSGRSFGLTTGPPVRSSSA